MEPKEKQAPLNLVLLEGYKVNKQGKVLNEDGEVIGELKEGDTSKCAGKKVNVKGEIHDTESQVIGKVKAITQKDKLCSGLEAYKKLDKEKPNDDGKSDTLPTPR